MRTKCSSRIPPVVFEQYGDSVKKDVRTGGANYWFTRIKREGRPTNGFFFDIRELARQDAVSYTEDEYGAISKFHRRGATIRDYKEFAVSIGNNETNFKEGLTWDQLDFIRVRPMEQEGLLKAFDDLGITHLPDGRPIEKIITTTSTPPPARYRQGYVEPAVNKN